MQTRTRTRTCTRLLSHASMPIASFSPPTCRHTEHSPSGGSRRPPAAPPRARTPDDATEPGVGHEWTGPKPYMDLHPGKDVRVDLSLHEKPSIKEDSIHHRTSKQI